MNVIGIGALFILGLVLLPAVIDIWQRMSPRHRLLVIAVAVLAFMLLACGPTPGPCEGPHCMDSSNDLTGHAWRWLKSQ